MSEQMEELWGAVGLYGVYKPTTPHNSSIHSDERLLLETSAF